MQREMDVSHPVLHRMMEWVKAHLSQGGEFAMMDGHELDRMAADLGIQREELLEFSAQGTEAHDLMERMLAAHHVNLEGWRRREPATIRDMEVQCSRCGSKDRCATDLDRHEAVEHCAQYCPNAESIVSLMNRA